MSNEAEEIAEVLAFHEWHRLGPDGDGSCSCGWNTRQGMHTSHVAAALLASPAMAERDARVRAEALREAADALNVDGVGFRPGWGSGNEGDQGALDALGKALQWLRDRADQQGRT